MAGLLIVAALTFVTLADYSAFENRPEQNPVDLKRTPLSAVPFHKGLNSERESGTAADRRKMIDAILARNPRDREALWALFESGVETGRADVAVDALDTLYRLAPDQMIALDEQFVVLYQNPQIRKAMHELVQTPRLWHDRVLRLMITNATRLSDLPERELLLADTLPSDTQRILVQQQIIKMVTLGDVAGAYEIWGLFHGDQPPAGEIVNANFQSPDRLYPFDWQSYDYSPYIETQWRSEGGVFVGIRNNDPDATLLLQRLPAPEVGAYRFAYQGSNLTGGRYGTLVWQAYCHEGQTPLFQLPMEGDQGDQLLIIPEDCGFLTISLNVDPSPVPGWIRAVLENVSLTPFM